MLSGPLAMLCGIIVAGVSGSVARHSGIPDPMYYPELISDLSPELIDCDRMPPQDAAVSNTYIIVMLLWVYLHDPHRSIWNKPRNPALERSFGIDYGGIRGRWLYPNYLGLLLLWHSSAPIAGKGNHQLVV